jgi:branched-chain amino acid transport system ATP-binding protein
MLEIQDLDVCYGPVPALRGVSMTVGDGEMVALVGANGAGKTTTLRTISGMLSPTGGTITFDGERIDGLPAYKVIAHGVAHLPEGRALFSDMSVMDNLRLGAWTQPSEKGYRRRVSEVMDHFPILRERSKQAAGTLSGGEQQMLGVARALMSSPKLLIVDELSLGLAPKIVAQLFQILTTINGEGTAVLMVEQFVHMALQHSNRAYVLAKGEVALEGDASELRDRPELLAAYLGDEAADEPVAVGS